MSDSQRPQGLQPTRLLCPSDFPGNGFRLPQTSSSSVGKESACNAGVQFYSWVRKMRWRRYRLPTPGFWPGEFRGLYGPWRRKESDTTERLFYFQTSIRCRKTNGEDNFPTDDLPCTGWAQDSWPGPPLLQESALVAEGELGWPLTPVYSIRAILPFFTHGSFCSAGR